jgi:hypothetical protein
MEAREPVRGYMTRATMIVATPHERLVMMVARVLELWELLKLSRLATAGVCKRANDHSPTTQLRIPGFRPDTATE